MSTKVIDQTAKGEIQFIQNHQTALDAGEYKIEIKQTIEINNNKIDEFSNKLNFAIQGDRFQLNPQDIHAVFPPAGSSGDHSHILPHIVLKSSTLPWERQALSDTEKQDVPWLGLIVIHEGEEAKPISGFLIRSEVISGWPDLQIDGSNISLNNDNPMSQEQKLKILRCDRISEDILICLFDGEIKTIDIALKPEGLHFGFNNDNQGNLWRELRALNGTEMSNWQVEKEEIQLIINEQKVINIASLADKIKNKLEENNVTIEDGITSAEFALQMVQGAEKVRFLSI